jgi:PKD repeat protein
MGADEYAGPVPCVADFSASPTSGPAPLKVTFTDQSTGTVDSWNWNFGDGSTSRKQKPSHTYNDPGTYTVSLTVTGPGGSDTETKADYIKVRSPGKAMPWILLLLLDTDNSVQSLLEKYAPILRFNALENFFPTRVDHFISLSSIDKEIMNFGTIPVTVILEEICPITASMEQKIETIINYTPTPSEQGIGFDLLDDDKLSSTDEVKIRGKSDMAVYARIAKSQTYSDRTYLQYWFFYMRSSWADYGGMNSHEGDWEMITVELDKDKIPNRVGYSQHIEFLGEYTEFKGGQKVPWESVEKDNGNHLVIYVGQGSHASYPKSGETIFASFTDLHWGDHPDYRRVTPSQYELIPFDAKTPWNVGYLRWGIYIVPIGVLGFNGPLSPIAQADRWSDPGAWLDSL